MKIIVLLLAMCLVAVTVSERRNGNAMFNQKIKERLMKVEDGFPLFPGISENGAGLANDAVCGGICKSRGGTEGTCRQMCLPGEVFERSQNCNNVPGQFCSCCVSAEILN